MTKVKFTFSILLVLTSAIISGQPVGTIANVNENIMYAGIENPIRISVSEIPNDHLKITSSDSLCKIERISRHEYVVTPEKTGSLDLIVMNVENDEVEFIGSYTFRVRHVPSPEISICGKKEGKIQKNIILAAPYILVNSAPHFNYNLEFKVIRFTITYKNGIEQSFVSESNKFTNELVEFIKEMESGQSFTLTEIIIQGPGGQRVFNAGPTFTIN